MDPEKGLYFSKLKVYGILKMEFLFAQQDCMVLFVINKNALMIVISMIINLINSNGECI